MSNHACDACGKTAEALDIEDARDGWWHALPPGWMRRLHTMFSEISGDNEVCSAECAQALMAREEAERQAKADEYERRRTAGELTPMEIWMERMQHDMLERLALDIKAYDGTAWSDEEKEKMRGADRIERPVGDE
jgi:hypothetical protein